MSVCKCALAMAVTRVVLAVKGELHTNVSYCHLRSSGPIVWSKYAINAPKAANFWIVCLCVCVVVWCGWGLQTMIVIIIMLL